MIKLPQKCSTSFSFSQGAYVAKVKFTNSGESFFRGTLRIERIKDEVYIISGDLYNVSQSYKKKRSTLSFPQQGPKHQFPIYPISNYTFYLSVLNIVHEHTNSEKLSFEFSLFKFDYFECFAPTSETSSSNIWSLEGTYTVEFTKGTNKDRLFEANFYNTGNIKNGEGVVVGEMKLLYRSNFFRKAIIEMDREDGLFFPLMNSNGLDWHDIFKRIGWDISILTRTLNFRKKIDSFWSISELRSFVSNHRSNTDLDYTWSYHLFCVKGLEDSTRGIMYDFAIGNNRELNVTPRRGVAVVCPPKNNQNNDFFFRTALHEIGHSMGLRHDKEGATIMRPTNEILRQKQVNIEWSFSERDQFLLKHLPDINIRPGGAPYDILLSHNYSMGSKDSLIDRTISFNQFSKDPINNELEVELKPVLLRNPIGSPVCINCELINNVHNKPEETTTKPIEISKSAIIDLTINCLSINNNKYDQYIAPFQILINDDEKEEIFPGRSKIFSISLLSNKDIPIFRHVGKYKLFINILLNTLSDDQIKIKAETTIEIIKPKMTVKEERIYNQFCHEIFATQEFLVLFSLGGGDNLHKGVRLLNKLLSNPVFFRHYSWLKAVQIGNSFFNRKGNLKRMAKTLRMNTVLGYNDIKKLKDVVASNKESQVSRVYVKHIKTILEHHLESMKPKFVYTNSIDALLSEVKKM